MKNENYGKRNEDLNFDISEWVKNGITEETVKTAENIGKYLAKNDLTGSQIRNIFGELRRIQIKGYKNEKTAFLMLKPKLAYAVKRNENQGTKSFYKVFCSGFDSIDKKNHEIGEKQFNNFMEILEAVLAYHKYYGGK